MNVVLIIADTARHDLATESLSSSFGGSDATQYRNAFASAPWSLPSHASLFTGTYSSKHGAHAGHKQLSPHLTTLAEIYRDAGYETVAVSNNTWISNEFGFERGFETFHKTWQFVQSEIDLGEIARTKEGREKYLALAHRLIDGNPLTNLTNAIYGQFLRKQDDDGAKQTTERIRTWLSDRADSRPFFLFLNYLEPHLKYHPPKEFADRFLSDGISYDQAMKVPQDAWAYIANETELSDRDFEVLRALYRAELAYLEERISELVRLLKDTGEWEETIFVITGDHGENIGDHGLMDHQYCLYDTLLHVPLSIRGGPFTGGETDRLVQLTDLAPTLLDATGIDAPDVRDQFQGVSFHPDADAQPRQYAIAEYMAPQPSMEALENRVGGLPEEIYDYDRSLRAIRSRTYKFIRGSDGSRQLYNLVHDPAEQHDVSEHKPDIVNEFDSELDDWLESFNHADISGSVPMSQSTKKRLSDLGYLQ